jgi:hypothetical protein
MAKRPVIGYNIRVSNIFDCYDDFFKDYEVPANYSSHWVYGWKPSCNQHGVNTDIWTMSLCVKNKDTSKYAPEYFYLMTYGAMSIITVDSGIIPVYPEYPVLKRFKRVWK